jgi:hypothetical protein
LSVVEAYVPVLLNFRENSLVYSTDDLERLRSRVLGPDNGVSAGTSSGEFAHQLSSDCLRESLGAVDPDGEVSRWVSRVEVYYYHHRIILKYVFGSLPSTSERRARQLILAHSRYILITRFVGVINTASASGGPLPDERGHVTSYYSYCVLFLPLTSTFQHGIENLLGSHTFRIVEVTPKLLERDRVHIVRISIPSTILYSRRPVRTFLRADILNAIYQHMLYAKKEQDRINPGQVVEFSAKDLDARNVMQEAQLHAFWDHAVDALGGRMVDLQGVHQQTLLFRASILALLLALVGIVITVGLAFY